MKVLVLNASPKGNNSVTLQTARFWQKLHSNDQFTTLNIAQKLRYYTSHMDEIAGEIANAEIIIIAYPVYTFIAPYQLHRFIELLNESNINFQGKYAMQLLTSKHFYDTTAMTFIEQNLLDLGAKYLGAHSADMDDLLTEKGQLIAKQFYSKMQWDIANNNYKTAVCSHYPTVAPYVSQLQVQDKTSDKDIIIVTNDDGQGNLSHMINDFIATTTANVRVFNVRQYNFHGGCLGCLQCTISGHCIYKDGFEQHLRQEVQSADAIVYAYSILNHFTHSSMKCYDDRQFCNGHRAVTMGKPTAYIISGNYNEEHNLQTIVKARSQVGGNYLAGVISDQVSDVAANIKNVSNSLMYALENNTIMQTNFYSAGGNRIFRDLIYTMRGMMKADHKFYVKHNLYDFPQKQRKQAMKMKLVGAMLSVPSVRRKILPKMNEYAIMPYDKMLDKVKPID